MIYEYILPCIYNQIISKWGNEKKEPSHQVLLDKVEKQLNERTEEEKESGRKIISNIIENSSKYKKELVDNQLKTETKNQEQNIEQDF